MITFLSGGTGTPKLLRGMQKVMDRHEIAVIVNTAEDLWISGNHISPDVDTVMYLFAGIQRSSAVLTITAISCRSITFCMPRSSFGVPVPPERNVIITQYFYAMYMKIL